MSLTTREKHACFQHAKEHVKEAINEALSEEHHSIMKVDGKERRDMQAQTEMYMRHFLGLIKAQKYQL